MYFCVVKELYIMITTFEIVFKYGSDDYLDMCS